MTQQREHLTRVGSYSVRDATVPVTLSDGSLGVSCEELGRLERRAAITVLSKVELVSGAELKFARKALGLRQSELAKKLGVSTETVSRWETGKETFQRQTQLAILQLLEDVERHGESALGRKLLPAGKPRELHARA